MIKGKNFLTTGDVARICNVAPRTVSKWFDTGQLKGYRIPGSRVRRIPAADLIRFMKLHNIPTTALPLDNVRVLIVDSDNDAALVLADTLRTKADYDVQTVRSNFETGAIAQKFAPHVLLINLMAKGIDAADICRNIRANEDLQTIKIIALVNSLPEPQAKALLQKGFDAYISNSDGTNGLVRKIEDTITAAI